MILDNVKTYYINSTSSKRLVRYDVIRVDNDNFIVKVFDDQQRGVSPPSLLVEVTELRFTRAEYVTRHKIGDRTFVRNDMAPDFEGDVRNECQKHRDSLQ